MASNTLESSAAGSGKPSFSTGSHRSRPSALTSRSTLMSSRSLRTLTVALVAARR
jgi:hypothetical protein